MLAEDLGEKNKTQEDLIGAEEAHWVGWLGLRPAPQVSPFLPLYTAMWNSYCIPLILNLWSSSRDLVCKTANVVAQVFLVVNSIDNFTEAAGLASLLATLEWADIQAVA
jgi:hypothetical protein